jgi:uncharacterized phiE125 gp8 family phage protein
MTNLEISMMLIEEASVPDEVLPLAAFKAHLRLGTGFAQDDVQDPVLKSFLKAALAAVEARTGKALISRAFSWSVTRWRDPSAESLPIAPVRVIEALEICDADGADLIVSPDCYALEIDSQRPKIIARGGGFGSIPFGGKASIRFQAGFGPQWSDLPDDLAQAVFLLAAHYYEYRDETSLTRGCMPFGVQTLIERYRPMRLFAGARA